MKEKILELIHKELENMVHKNIFLCINSLGVYTPTNPVNKEESLISAEYFTESWTTNNKKYEQHEVLDFILTFPDGDPPIKVKSVIDSVNESKPKKKKFLGIFNVETNILEFKYTNFVTTKIMCGKFEFDLTEVERDELLERAKFAYQRFTLEEDKQYEEKITNKLNFRLKKWEK